MSIVVNRQQWLSRYFINEETSVAGDVVSTLNMSAVGAADGGRYTCRAHNALGHALHSARLNVYGTRARNHYTHHLIILRRTEVQ